MEFGKLHIFGLSSGGVIALASLLLIGTNFFFLVMGIGVIVAASPFVFSMIKQARDESEKEEMFMEFSRDLVEGVKTGTPISRSIINVRNKPYGVLSENVKKLANQVSMGIPLNSALQVFAKDVDNRTISRAITLIGQAEKSGGDIGEILEAVAESVRTADKLKKERKSVISSLVMQGYIIFVVFIVIVLIMQFRIIPMLSNISGLGDVGGQVGLPAIGGGGGPSGEIDVSNAFLYLLLIQGFFSGLAIGKLSEGSVKYGIKHSFVLMLISFFASTGANIVFGG